MGIDLIAGGRSKKTHRRNPKSKDVYLRLLVKLYDHLARRTTAKFNKIVLKRLYQSNMHRPQVSLSRIAAAMRNKGNKIAVLVGKVLDDERLFSVPKLRVCALRFSESARARIIKAGGEVLTFDQLAQISPEGRNTVLIRGKVTAREAYKHFGVPGSSGSHAKPYVRSKGNQFERARGRRPSKGFKVKA